MPAKDVKAYVKRNKNDAADAEAICEAVRRPTMRFVRAKSAEQQGRLMQHRTDSATGTAQGHHANGRDGVGIRFSPQEAIVGNRSLWKRTHDPLRCGRIGRCASGMLQ